MTPEMDSTVAMLSASGHGILAADESGPTIAKRFEAQNVVSTEEHRRQYREMLFSTSGLGKYISGAILFDETIRQKSSSGVGMPEMLAAQGIVVGIKVDAGTVPLPSFAGEKMTEGLDGLRGRLAEYRTLGARFTKWRAVIAIGDNLPTDTCIATNAEALALFAALSQEANLVPIVEPEVLMDGDHTIERAEATTAAVLTRVFAALGDHRVALERMIVKTSMVLSGAGCPQQADLPSVAEATLRCLRRAVPATVPAVLFLSGGQPSVTATERLNAICRAGNAPWTLSFSFGRALESPALEIWDGSPSNVPAAQSALHHRARCNAAAVRGAYLPAMEAESR